MSYVMGLKDSCYTSTRIFPMLKKNIRKRWAVAWHIFLEGAQSVAERVQFVLFQDDEKWFYALVVRQHNKMVPFLLSPSQESHWESDVPGDDRICSTQQQFSDRRSFL
eukprot:scaffold119792_cov34-Attheya_sp.AAC.1